VQELLMIGAAILAGIAAFVVMIRRSDGDCLP
jgi:hypothetical protein